MNLTDLKKKGFKIVTNWQECNKNSIFLFDSKNQSKFIKYINLAIKKKCNFFICNIKLKGNIKQKSINFFFYNNNKDLENIVKIFYRFIIVIKSTRICNYFFTIYIKSITQQV